MENSYNHPVGEALIDMFGGESLRPMLKDKILEMLYTIIEIKKMERQEREDNSISFQKKWVKALEEEYKQREAEHWETYKKNLFNLEKSNVPMDKELTKYICKYVIKLDLERLSKEVRKAKGKLLTTLIKQGKYEPPKTHITPDQIEAAKQVPIRDLAGISTSTRLLFPCPFHREKTGSFKIYEEQNRFKCFGCGVFGDSITFIQIKHNLDFIQAVRFLLNI